MSASRSTRALAALALTPALLLASGVSTAHAQGDIQPTALATTCHTDSNGLVVTCTSSRQEPRTIHRSDRPLPYGKPRVTTSTRKKTPVKSPATAGGSGASEESRKPRSGCNFNTQLGA